MNLGGTDVWLAIIAVATMTQALVIVIGAVVVTRRIRQVEGALTLASTDLRERLDRTSAMVERAVNDAKPVMTRATQVLDDLADLATRARRAEAEVRTALDRVSLGVQIAKTAIAARAWPALGLVRGLAAGLRVVRSRRAARTKRDDALALARFVNEGGSHG